MSDPDRDADRDPEVLKQKLNMLRAAVLRYLDNPGCSSVTRKMAMERLRWAAEQP